jgi:hypothetical protein
MIFLFVRVRRKEIGKPRNVPQRTRNLCYLLEVMGKRRGKTNGGLSSGFRDRRISFFPAELQEGLWDWCG